MQKKEKKKKTIHILLLTIYFLDHYQIFIVLDDNLFKTF